MKHMDEVLEFFMVQKHFYSKEFLHKFLGYHMKTHIKSLKCLLKIYLHGVNLVVRAGR